MKLLQLLRNLLIFSILGTQCLALRFSHVPITVDSDVILVNKPAELTCNYVKFRTETVREINWFITYQGFSAKVLIVNSVQEACAKCFGVHLLKFEILQTT